MEAACHEQFPRRYCCRIRAAGAQRFSSFDGFASKVLTKEAANQQRPDLLGIMQGNRRF